MSKKTPNISTYFFLSSITKKSNQRIFEVSWHLSFDFESRNLSSVLNTMVESHFKKSQFTSTFSWVSLNFGVKNQTEERFSRDIQILNKTFFGHFQKLCHEIISVIIRIEWWLWRRSIIEASLPMASCQNVRPSHLQCPTADLRVMHGFCRSTSTFFYNAQCLKITHKSLIWILRLPTIIFVSRQLFKYLRLFSFNFQTLCNIL